MSNNSTNGQRSRILEDLDERSQPISQPQQQQQQNPNLNRRGSSNLTLSGHSPLDEEYDDDETQLFRNIGLLTDNCVSTILGSSSSSSNRDFNYDKNESFPLTTKTTSKSSNSSIQEQHFQVPQRSWTMKLQAASSRNFISQNQQNGSMLTPSSVNSSTNSNHFRKNLSSPTATPSSPPSTNFDCLKGPHPSLMSEENFNFVSVEHADTSFPVFLELWQNQQVCDVTIVVGERRFSAHRVILCATIPYFYAMFTSEMMERNAAEVVLQAALGSEGSEVGSSNSVTPGTNPTASASISSSMEPEAFESLLRYAYTGSIVINSRNVQSILIGASFLGLVNVQQACADYLKIRLNVSNVLNVKSFAFALGCDTLVTASKKYIHRHFEEISRTEDFLALEFEEVRTIIEKDELNILGEECVFAAVIAWTKKDEERRKEFLPNLLANVRLPLLSPEYLTDFVMVEKLVRSSLPCRDLVDEAKDYHLLPARRELMQRFRTRPRFGHHIQGLIYAVGGLTKSGDSMSTVEMYDPNTKRWRMAEAMSMLRSRVGVGVLDGKLYAIGGYNGKERLNTVELYDSKQKRWNKVNSMCFKRSAVGAAPMNGYLYVCGGYDGATSLNALERYSAVEDRWDAMCSMNFHRSAAGVVAFDGYIYALGGHDGMMIFNSVERYDPRTNRWEVVEPMLTRRCRLGVAAFGGKIYACGGYDGCTFLQSAEVFDPNTGKWSYITPMRVTRSRVALVANCGRLFAIGGYDGISNLSSVEMYDIERNCWEYTASMVAHEGGVGVGVIPDCG